MTNIKGSEDKPGLAALAMAEILSAVEENGNLIAVSVYEVYQDNVLDVLDANKKVQLFENAHGYTELRGISQASHDPILSITINRTFGNTSSV